MAAPKSINSIRAPGALVANPTDLSLAYPYGGVELGKTRVVVLQSFGEQYVIEGEVSGSPSDVLEANQKFAFSCVLRGWDDDAVTLLLSDHARTGGVSGHTSYDVTHAGSATPGASALARAVKLLFVPDDVLAAPALLMQRAVPQWRPTSELPWSHDRELAIEFAAECIDNGSGRILTIGRLADLTL